MRALPVLVTVLLATGLAVAPATAADDPTEITLNLTPVADVAVAGSNWSEEYPASPDSGSLGLGDFPDSTRGHAYLRFDTSSLPPGEILSATLRVTATAAPGCDPASGNVLEVRRVTEPWDPGFLWWGDIPGSTPDGAQVTGQPCAIHPGQMTWPVTDLVREWRGGAADHGLVLQPADEITGDGYWVLASSENEEIGGPVLTITMDAYSAPALVKTGVHPSIQKGLSTVVRSVRPSFSGYVSDPVGGILTAEFELEHDPAATGQGTGLIWTGTVASPVPGTPPAQVRVPAGLLQDGYQIRWRGRAHNVSHGTVSGWSDWRHGVVTVPRPEISSTEVVPSIQTGVTTSLTPELRAVVVQPDGGVWRVTFQVEHDPDVPEQGTGPIWTGIPGVRTAPEELSAVVPAGLLQDGYRIRWRVRATSGSALEVSSDWQEVTVELE